MAFNPWRGLRNLPAEAWIIFATTLVNRAGTMVLPFLVLYLTQDLGHPAGQAGFALTALRSGWVDQRATRRPALGSRGRVARHATLVAALRRAAADPPSRPLADGGIQPDLPVGRDLREAVRPASLAALAGATPPAQRKAAIALNRLAINLGMSVGPAVGGFLATAPFFWLFAIDGATSMAAAALLTGLLWRRPKGSGRRDSLPQRPARPVRCSDRRMLAFMVAWFLVGVMFFQLDGGIPALRGSRSGAVPGVLRAVVHTEHGPDHLSRGSDQPEHDALAAPAGSGSGRAVAGIRVRGAGLRPHPLEPSRWPWSCLTFGEMIVFPVAATYVSELAPADRQGEYMGAYWMALSFAMMVGPWAGTLVMDRFGSRVLWTAVFACGLGAAAMFRLVVDERSPSGESESG